MKRISFMVLAVAAMTLIASCGTSAPATTQVPVSQPPTQPAAIPSAAAAVPSAAAGGTVVSFAKDVMPILNNSCTKCHGVEQVKAGLDMRTYDTLMAGSFKGADIIAGSAETSKLIELILSGKMPKRGEKLTPEQIQLITDWINAGALNN